MNKHVIRLERDWDNPVYDHDENSGLVTIHLDNGDKVFSCDSLNTLSCRLESALEE